MEAKHWFLKLFLILNVTLNFLSCFILLTILASYTRLKNNTLLSSHCFTCILLHTNSTLMVPFPNLLLNVYPVFPIKSAIIAKKTRFNRKQIRITSGFAYNKYKVQGATFKSLTFDLWHKLIKKSTKSHRRFCFIYVQLFRLQSLEKVLLLKPLFLNNIINQPYHEIQAEDDLLPKLGNITSLSFANVALKSRWQMRDY